MADTAVDTTTTTEITAKVSYGGKINLKQIFQNRNFPLSERIPFGVKFVWKKIP